MYHKYFAYIRLFFLQNVRNFKFPTCSCFVTKGHDQAKYIQVFKTEAEFITHFLNPARAIVLTYYVHSLEGEILHYYFNSYSTVIK